MLKSRVELIVLMRICISGLLGVHSIKILARSFVLCVVSAHCRPGKSPKSVILWILVNYITQFLIFRHRNGENLE